MTKGFRRTILRQNNDLKAPKSTIKGLFKVLTTMQIMNFEIRKSNITDELQTKGICKINLALILRAEKGKLLLQELFLE